jgi:glycosyltransferase involved in cell wall biosynthesis
VDILRAHGREAYVRHTSPGYRLTWFANDTPVIDEHAFRDRFDPASDIIVLPEDLGTRIGTFPGRKVIFNQNVFYGFYTFGFRTPPEYPYLRDDVIGAMVVSEHNRDYLRFAFPQLPVHRVVNGIDASRFRFGDRSRKRLQIACVPTKAEMDLTQVIHILAARARQGLNRLQNLEWVHLRGLSEADVAQHLEQSLFLLFVNIHEGMGMLPLEAMLSGVVVAGYSGGPLVEYLSEDVAVTARPGDCVALVQGIERVAAWFRDEDDRWKAMVDGARHVASWHSPAREQQTVIDAWNALLP